MDVTRRVQPNAGILLTLLLVAIPMYGWKIGYQLDETELWRVIAFSFAKIGAFGGMAMFAISLILSGRYRWYDRLFGGLDKMYIAHRFLGTFSVLLLFIHPLSLSLLRLEEGTKETLSLWFKTSDFGIWLGGIALYLLVGIVVWSISTRAKYETFLIVHRVLGIVFILGALHAFLSGSILASNAFMFWYMFILTVAATLTFITYSIIGDVFHRPLKYTVERVRKLPHDIVEVDLKPSRRILNFSPGQFVYVRFENLAKHGYHPFSISSSKTSSTLRLAVRSSGDFTTKLADVELDSLVQVKGSYGRFLLPAKPREKQLWIAGGIGVTPFVSGAQSLRKSSRMHAGTIEMIYATDDKNPYAIETLQAVEEDNKAFNVTVFDKKTFGYVSFAVLKEHITDLEEREIFICGPPPMLNALREEAEAMGISHQLSFEEFNY